MLTRQTRTGTYGSWYQYYLCDFGGTIILPDPGFADELNALVAPIQDEADRHLLLQRRREV